MVSEMLIAS